LFQYASQHHFETVDAFGFTSSGILYEVKAILSLRAYILLKEEYPATIPYLSKDNNTEMYILALQINNPKPLLRFAKGLPAEITITGNTAWQEYITNNNTNNI